MKPLIITLLLVIIAGSAANAGEPNYAASSIPPELLRHAHAVIRSSHEEIRIVSPHEVYVTKKYAVTVLDQKGAGFGIIREFFDNFRDVESIQGQLFDKNGQFVKKLKKKDIRESAPMSYNLIDENHCKLFAFDYNDYPYTCEYEIETKMNMSFALPPWYPQQDYSCSVDSASFDVIYPKGFAVRHHEMHLGKKPEVSYADDHITLSYRVDKITAKKTPDEFAPSENEILPHVLIAADSFELGNIPGSMATWRDFGAFVYHINENRDTLPPAIKKLVHQLTDTCTSQAQKIALLYKYMQGSTRYVSIQLGIGGWQTLTAGFVGEKGYGDCKALSNYMKSLLKEAGITAYGVLVNAGLKSERPMLRDFPCNRFNHMILCVPRQNDTTWLECTSQTNPAGYLSSFTDDRYVLMLTPDGGFPVKTPVYTVSDNWFTANADLYVNDNDEMNGTVDLRYSGLYWDGEHGIANVSKSQTDDYMNRKLRLANYSVAKYAINNDVTGKIPCISESITVAATGNVSRSGKHLFVSPAVLPLMVAQPSNTDSGRKSFHIQREKRAADTVTFHFSKPYVPGSVKDNTLDFPFASYSRKVLLKNDSTLQIITTYQQKEGAYPGEDFNEYVRMTRLIKNDESSKIVLARKE